MNTNRNFSQKITPNTVAEREEVLRAVIEKKPVFFYQYDQYASTIKPKRFEGLLPLFEMYRYDLTGTAMNSRTRIKFEKDQHIDGIIAKFRMSTHVDRPLEDFDAEVWTDGKTTFLKPNPKSNLKVVQDGTREAPPKKPAPVAPAPKKPIPNVTPEGTVNEGSELYHLWKRVCNSLRGTCYYRSAQPYGAHEDLATFCSGTLDMDRYYRLVFCFEDGTVGVTKQSFLGEQLRHDIVDMGGWSFDMDTGEYHTVNIFGVDTTLRIYR